MAINTGPSGGKKWIQNAVTNMKKNGTVGAFGPATNRNIAAGKAAGGKQKKRAIFAQNMRNIARGK